MKISTQFIKCISGFFGMLLLLTPISVLAQTKVVVVPLCGDDAKPLKNIITVAKENGNFTHPITAIKSITDASAENPYLLVIGPGVYTMGQTLAMKPYVDIVGSGENVTKLRGAISAGSSYVSSCMILGADNATLSSLTVENTGGSTLSVALYNKNASPRLSNLTIKASGGAESSYAVYNDTSSPTMTNVTITASGPGYGYGVFNIFSSSPTMTNVDITALGGTGVHNGYASCPTMTTTTIKAGTGVSNGVGSKCTMTNVAITALGGTGLSIFDSSHCDVSRSTIQAFDIMGTYFSGARFSQSTLIGAVTSDLSSTISCVACDNGSGKALDANCLIP
jgi:hypothetical protein